MANQRQTRLQSLVRQVVLQELQRMWGLGARGATHKTRGKRGDRKRGHGIRESGKG
ncbi:MAG: hypothetical protein K6T81_05775 [Alicyclobacillus macrosporangiidus]|uniref:hypothetical protein n=1 Tax=Alicyclobacillus macrosporangiidus TaxID=392015 RepID=UPI0026EC0561|nr:hypothetical protein [Alicyclobacillus macrosporangiidus]MCL6598234.1 hypothetical protein [Alicyclobacillus macrosporangiidus]